ncbi:DUF3006 domain-containing protein [Candidatus Uhrbacteria bacterium]|nr:DUF3006 domain-containing protein [Candidatus Uhrbacteria bacterium]
MFPAKTVTCDRLEGDVAVLKTDDGQELHWKKSDLPKGTKVGDVLSLTLLTNTDLTEERTNFAKTMLNEILAPEQQ